VGQNRVPENVFHSYAGVNLRVFRGLDLCPIVILTIINLSGFYIADS
jgi:hypothetical protein